MPDEYESDQPKHGDSDGFPTSDPTSEWYAEQWDTLCDVLGTSEPEEVVPRVRTLKEQLDKIDAEAERAAPDGLITISEVEEVFQEMHTKLKRLRERNAALVEQLEAESEGDADATVHALHVEMEDLLQALGVSTVEEGQERVESLQQQLNTLYADKEALVEAGLTGADEALEEIDRLHDRAERATAERDEARAELQDVRAELQDARSERDQLRDECDTAQAERDRALKARDKAQNARDEALAEKDDLEQSLSALKEERDALRDERDTLRTERDRLKEKNDTLQAERDRLKEQQPSTETLEALSAMESILGLHTPEEARALARSVRKMKERLDDLSMLRDRIADEIGLSNPEDLLAMVENMEQQLVDLYEDRATETDRIPEAIVKTLGVSSPEEADELARAVRRMDERLRTLSSQQERLAAEAGVENADDALSMIRSLEEQLVDLYQERDPNSQGDGSHAPNGVSSSQTDAVSPETDADAPEADAPEADAPEEVFRILGVSTPREARDMAQVVRRMSQRLNALSEEYSKVTSDLGLEDADDTRAMIESMEEQLVDLYQTVEARGTAGDAGQPAGGDATPSGDGAPADHDIDPRVGEILGIQTAEEARELEQLVHDITSQLEHLTAEQEKLQAQGLESVDGALAMIESMEEQLVNVYEQQGTPAEDAAEEAEEDTSEPDTATDVAALMPSRPGDAPAASDETGSDETSSDETSSDAEASAGEAPDPAVYDKMRTLLGVESMEDVEELGEMVHSMSEQLDRLASEHQKLLDVGLSVDHALSMIESMEEQLVDLYQEREGDGAAASAEIPEDAVSYADLQPSLHALCDTLGVDRPADAMSPQESLAAIHDRTQHLLDEGNRVFDDTASIEPASTLSGLLQRVEEQMVDLHHEVNTLQEAKQRFDGVREVLGIETRDQAQELAQLAREMDVQLQQLQENEEALEEIGLSSAQDAVQMIRSMEQQLDELYRDKENLQQQSDAMTINPDQDTFQQLQALYAEQEKLERELGVSSADAIIEMVEGLATQLDDFYASSEGIPYDESGDGSLTAPPDTPADAPSADASVPDKDFMILSMREQLEALYQEKEALFENGMGDVNEAVSRIGMLQDRVNQLSRENTAYEKRLQRLKNEIGTADVQKVIKIVRSLKSRVLQREERKGSASPSGSASAGNASSSDAASPERGTGLFISAAPQFADDETLDRLEEMSSSELNDLPYGVIRLANDGSVEFVNEQGLSLPGLEEVNQRSTLSGKNFFLDLAPSTKNNLFFGRFKEGLRQGAMDARFPYTFISPGRAPKVLTVHLHRKPDEDANWLLFRSM